MEEMTTTDGTIVRRRPIAGGDGKSGALLEHVELADGRVFVVKHIDPASDWIVRATGSGRRLLALWSSGLFERVPPAIDHAIVAVEPEGETGSTVVMRDMSASLFPDDPVLARNDGRRILVAATELHRAFADGPVPANLIPLAELYRLLSPASMAQMRADAVVPRIAAAAWERFASIVPADVAEIVSWVHSNVDAFAALLTARRSTLLHGDLKVGNLGFSDDRVVMLDWGTQTVWAPPAYEFAWFLAINSAAIDATLDEMLDDVRSASGADYDDVAMRLALLGAFAQLGWEKATGAVDAPDEAVRAREQAGLLWWCHRAREAADLLR